MLNVKYLLVSPQKEINDPKFQKVFDGELRIYENKGVLPRVFVVFKATVIKDKYNLLTTLLSNEFNPGQQVLLERDPPVTQSAAKNTGGRSSAEVLAYSPHRVVVRAHLAEDGFLVLGDSYFPGWKAFVNGMEVPIYQADYILRAVFLNEGENKVEFIYDPWSFKLGIWISLSTMLLLLGICLHTGITRFTENSIWRIAPRAK
jgi:hypothetical protein